MDEESARERRHWSFEALDAIVHRRERGREIGRRRENSWWVGWMATFEDKHITWTFIIGRIIV